MKKRFSLFALLFLVLTLVVNSQQVSTVCYNEKVKINLTGFTGKGIIQWQQSSDQATWTDIAGQTSEQLIVTATSNLYYKAKVSEGTCNPYISQVSQVFIVTLPDKANAGTDIIQSTGNTATLAANVPVNGTGAWSIVSGDAGKFNDATKANAIFTGISGEQYMLKWTISNDCGNTEVDYVSVYFGTLTVGMSYGGGIIYTLSNSQHGVIVSNGTVSSTIWGCYGTAVGASSNTNGEANTQKIAASCSDKTAAGNVCADYVSNYYDNWFLPSQNEVRDLAGSSIGLDSGLKWWSSSEYDANNGWYVEYKSIWGLGTWVPTSNNKGNVANVRCLRSF